jgi:hypothetical protein
MLSTKISQTWRLHRTSYNEKIAALTKTGDALNKDLTNLEAAQNLLQ